MLETNKAARTKGALIARATLVATFPIISLSLQAASAPKFVHLEDVPAPINATELIYSPIQHRLVLKNTASAIALVNLENFSSITHFSNYEFSDMALSPSGRYVFAADYGGENIGYGTPRYSSYVHRLDLASDSWETKTAYIAGRIQVISDDQFVLTSLDQWVTFTNNIWGSGSAVVPVNTPSGSWGPAFYAGVYYGDFRYAPGPARLIHGNSGSSSREIHAFKILNNEFVVQEDSGIYGSAQSFGGGVALATDTSAFYYGALKVDALDVTHNVQVFPEIIKAATGGVAFGDSSYYDANTGQYSGTFGFSGAVYGLNPDPNGADLWVYDPAASMLRHFVRDDVFSGGFDPNP
jgi:hypothetical protein